MKGLMEEAREIIEMSLKAQVDKDAYVSKAKDWLARADRQPGGTHDAYCAKCGNDLVCPSCD